MTGTRRGPLAAPTRAALSLAALALAACDRAPADLRLPEGTPVVLVSIDTLRSDRLPA